MRWRSGLIYQTSTKEVRAVVIHDDVLSLEALVSQRSSGLYLSYQVWHVMFRRLALALVPLVVACRHAFHEMPRDPEEYPLRALCHASFGQAAKI